MTIEMSPREYWKNMNYYDGLLYLSVLSIDGKNDWRMFKNNQELATVMYTDMELWYSDDELDVETVWNLEYDKFLILPVRDV
jgi:hypothetical protein